jgi:hypothetical protein
MNTEYVWWILALLLAGGGVVAFLAFGRVPEIEDDPTTELGADATAYSEPVSTTVPGPGAPSSTSDTP